MTATGAGDKGGEGVMERTFPDEWSCTAWEDCQHDGVCHDPKNCGAIGPNHAAFYGLDDEAEAGLAALAERERE